MKAWSWVVACSLASSVALTCVGTDVELARAAAPRGISNATASNRPMPTTIPMTGKRLSHL